MLAPGVVTLTEEDGKREAAVHSGFAEILGDRVTMMAEIAEWPDEIDKNRAMKAEERARRRLEAMEADLDYKRAEIALRKALVRLDITER